MLTKTIILNITPQTNVRSVQGDRIYFRIPKDKLLPAGLKRRNRLERYNQYKSDLFDLSLDMGFSIPNGYFHVTFFLPIPKSLRSRKKRAQMSFRAHDRKPDIDNLSKAFFDSLKKDDQKIYDVRLTKVWVDEPDGYIEVSY